MPSPSQALLDHLSSALPPTAHSWLVQALRDDALLHSRLRVRTMFTQLARKLGPGAESSLSYGPHAANQLDLARLTLVLAALETLSSSEHVGLVEELYRTGEQREQQSILRILAWLPDPARFTALAIHACRTNSLAVFGAIANDNPFPAAHFPELNFNQLVLKAIFLGVSVVPIVGLAQRANPELRRMLEEFASERRAATRPVPDDVGRALAFCER